MAIKNVRFIMWVTELAVSLVKHIVDAFRKTPKKPQLERRDDRWRAPRKERKPRPIDDDIFFGD